MQKDDQLPSNHLVIHYSFALPSLLHSFHHIHHLYSAIPTLLNPLPLHLPLYPSFCSPTLLPTLLTLPFLTPPFTLLPSIILPLLLPFPNPSFKLTKFITLSHFSSSPLLFTLIPISSHTLRSHPFPPIPRPHITVNSR